MCSGTEEGGRKGRTPKGAAPVGCALGHAVKSCMTLIEIDGELSEEAYDRRMILWSRPDGLLYFCAVESGRRKHRNAQPLPHGRKARRALCQMTGYSD